jgi:hypothetical protein
MINIRIGTNADGVNFHRCSAITLGRSPVAQCAPAMCISNQNPSAAVVVRSRGQRFTAKPIASPMAVFCSNTDHRLIKASARTV